MGAAVCRRARSPTATGSSSTRCPTPSSGDFCTSIRPTSYAMWLLLVMTGMRRGEVLGLRWKDVDLAAGRVAVRQTLIEVAYGTHFGEPKTKRSRRSVSIDQVTVAALAEHRECQ